MEPANIIVVAATAVAEEATTCTAAAAANAATLLSVVSDIERDTRSFDTRLFRCMCVHRVDTVHVLAPIVAKAQTILRDAAPYLEAMAEEEEE